MDSDTARLESSEITDGLCLVRWTRGCTFSLCSGASAKKMKVEREHTPYTCVPTGSASIV